MKDYENIIDIHCHLLPAIDDGPSDWNETLDMVCVAQKNNIKKIITTPHWIQGTSWQPSARRVKGDVKKLNRMLGEKKIDIEVFPGMEIGITERLPELLRKGVIITLANSKYILLEIPFISLPMGIEDILFSLISQGLIPVLAHPERNKEFQSEPDRVLEFINRGALIQITAGSLCGYWGNGAMECSVYLVDKGVVFAIASDGHSPLRRPPEMFEGINILEEIIGEKKTRTILSNVEKILDGQ